LLCIYTLQFVMKFILCNSADTEGSLVGQYCYPATSLMSAYKTRRQELAAIHEYVHCHLNLFVRFESQSELCTL